jgi:phosphoglycerate kinase
MFNSMEGFDFNGKSVLIRVDVNSPVKDGKLVGFTKIEASADVLRELSDKNAKVVVLSHQGREGKEDFISLRQHAQKLSEYLVGKRVDFVDDVIGEKAISRIKSLEPGQILILDNVRFVKGETDNKTPEEHAKGELVTMLSPLFDVFINDAFPSCKNSHASVVGFTKTLPSLTGRLLEKEVSILEMVMKDPERPIALMFGGAKPDEPLAVIKNMISRVDSVMLYGVLGNLFLVAKDFDLGKETMDFLDKKGYLGSLDEIRKLIVAHDDKIETPIDFAFESAGKRAETDDLPAGGLVKDIGSKTVAKYAGILSESKTVIVKGPAGVYEEPNFQNGTKELLLEASKVKFSLVGGGHTTDALEDLGIGKGKFTHVSLSGGAFIEYLAGKKLPGIEALKV